MKRTVVLILLAAFLLAGLLAAMPHDHLAHGTAGQGQHDCSACRAQSAQPLVEPPILLGVSPLFLLGTEIFSTDIVLSGESRLLPESRAPPSPL